MQRFVMFTFGIQEFSEILIYRWEHRQSITMMDSSEYAFNPFLWHPLVKRDWLHEIVGFSMQTCLKHEASTTSIDLVWIIVGEDVLEAALPANCMSVCFYIPNSISPWCGLRISMEFRTLTKGDAKLPITKKGVIDEMFRRRAGGCCWFDNTKFKRQKLP